MCRTPPPEALAASSSAPLEVDDIQSDDAYGDELSTYSASLTSSVVNFPTVQGRRYHAYREGRYLLPNDETESDRLDVHHELINKVLGGRLHVAPISEKPQRVLDLCTGTGIWVMDFADEHPSAEVTGNDLSPTQPSMVPPNAKFIVDDVEDEWGYEETPFDYVHGRFLVGSIRDWPRLMRQAFSCTKPGGWVEFQEWDANIYSEDDSINGTSLFRLQDTVKSVFEDMGINVNPGPGMRGWLETAGFVNVKTEKYKVPLGTWPRDTYMKTLGTFNLLQHLEGIEGIANVPLSKIGWSHEEIQVLLAQARADLKDRKVHSLFDYYVVYAQKPGQG